MLEGRFVPFQNIQAYRWSGCTDRAPQQQMEVNGELNALTVLYVGQSPWCPLNRGLGVRQSRSGRF